MSSFAAVARTGVASVLLHPLRSLVAVVSIVAVVLPYAAGAGVAEGLLDQAEASIREGADLYVTGTRFGRPAPLPDEALGRVRAITGVRSVTPRIVGEVRLGIERLDAIVVGLPPERLPPSASCVEGRLFAAGALNELVFGRELARRLHLRVGDMVPPFYRNDAGERISTVVGLFDADSPVWAAHLVFCSLETASAIFAQEGLVTGLLVDCDPGYRPAVMAAILRLDRIAAPDAHGPVAAAVASREELRALMPQSLRHLHGIFHLHFVLAFAVGIPLLMVVSGLGLPERRREAALLKATGWMTDQLLLRGMVESLILCAIGASAALLLAWGWLGPLNARGIAGVFLPGAEAAPAFAVPYRLAPAPALMAFVVSFAIVSVGTVYSTWRAATAPPALALR